MFGLIDACYIAHTSECTGWDLDDIIRGTLFKKSARTWRYPNNEEVQMLDWDFRAIEKRGFSETLVRHLELVRNNDLEVVMSPDYFLGMWSMCYEQYKVFSSLSKRVVMPVHLSIPEGYEVEVAWPMGVWTKDVVSIWDVQEYVTHLLGGSPHAQMEMSGYFPNVVSVDGNQAFWCAVKFGKFWDGKWTKPERELSNEECFRITVNNVTSAWEELG